MQVIPENLNITAGYHVFETPDDIIINSQIYDKITMEPKPYNFFNTNYCFDNKNLLLHEINILEYPWAMIAKEPGYKYYIQDSQDSSIFYCLTEQAYNNQNQFILKIQKTDTGWIVLKNIAPDSGYRYGNGVYAKTTGVFYKLVGQTDKFIVAISTSNGADYVRYGNSPRLQTLTYIIVNKLDMSIKYINVGAYYDYSVYLIKETNDSVYVFENLAGRLRISRIDTYTNTRTEFFSKDCGIDNKSIGISNIVNFKDKWIVMTSNANGTKYAFQELSINFEYNIFLCIEKNIEEDNDLPFHYGTNRPEDMLNGAWLQIDLKNIDNTFISVTIHDNRNKYHSYAYHWRDNDGDNNNSNPWQKLDQTVLSTLKYHRHILYKYDEDSDEWVSKGVITPDEETQHIYGVLYYDQYTPIFLLNTRVMAYRLNLETEKYEKVFEKPGTFYTIGLDENNKFYMFDSNNNCYIYNDVSSYELFAVFEQDSYKYNNSPIQTYVTISSKNFVSEYITTKVELTLEGNCKFTENNKKTLVTYTQDTGELNVPVTVTNGGTMYCYIKEVE